MQRRHAAICAALVIITAIPALAQEPALGCGAGCDPYENHPGID